MHKENIRKNHVSEKHNHVIKKKHIQFKKNIKQNHNKTYEKIYKPTGQHSGIATFSGPGSQGLK
jgi:hypothetical protein